MGALTLEELQKEARMRGKDTGQQQQLRPDLYERPMDTYQSVQDELETDLHLSRRARSFEERVTHCIEFISLGLSFLPEEEESYKETLIRYVTEEIVVSAPDTTPMFDSDKTLIYEIKAPLGTGFTTRALAVDMPPIRQDLGEKVFFEAFKKLSFKRDELVAKLVKYGILEREEEYGGGKIAEHTLGKRGHGRRARFERYLTTKEHEDPEEDPEEET